MNSLAYVISTRVRIARNLQDHRFPPNASERERQDVLSCVRQAFDRKPCVEDGRMLLLDRLDPLERKVLEEEHVISHLSAVQGSARAAIVSQTRDRSVLINEEDHLRIQAFSPGLALQKSLRAAQAVERCLQDSLHFAYSEREGYLSSCPKNSGTGLRISAMFFLPGLILLRRIMPLIQSCVLDAYTVRGAHGEGSQAQGFLLQLSLQAPYAQAIHTSVEAFARRCRLVIQQERLARAVLSTGASHLIRKRFHRARQRLTQSRSLSVASGIQMLAVYRLGVCLGLQPPEFRRAVMPESTRMRYLQGFDRLSRQIQAAHIRREQLRSPNGDVPEDNLRARLLQEGVKALIQRERGVASDVGPAYGMT